MAADKYQQLVERLAVKTDQGEVYWKEAAGPDTFQISFPNYSLTLSSQNRQGSILYVISILNSEGRTVDSFSDEDLDGDGRGGRYFTMMGELYHNARRQALGVDKALDEILGQLDHPF
jgi:hypothetical protein